MAPALTAFLSASLIALITLGGCWVFTHLTGPKPKDRFIQLMIALGAGYMLGAAFFDLLPMAFSAALESPEKQGMLMVGGILSVILVNQAILGSSQHAHHHLDHGHTHGSHSHSHSNHDHGSEDTCTEAGHTLTHQTAGNALLCLSICSFFDGITVSSSSLAAKETGFLILIGQAFHLLPEGIMAAGLSFASGAGKKRAFKASLTIGAIFLLGSIVPLMISNAVHIFLPISAGIITYVTLSQLLPEATERRSGVAAILLGLLFYWGLHELLHH